MEDSEKVKVLIVEDEPEFLELYRLKLTLDGYDVIAAKSGKEALDKASSRQPQLILLDIKMPEMDGFEVLKKLRSEPGTKNTPVVILSNFDEQEMIEKGLSLGANEYLLKFQFTPEEISSRIKNWVEH